MNFRHCLIFVVLVCSNYFPLLTADDQQTNETLVTFEKTYKHKDSPEYQVSYHLRHFSHPGKEPVLITHAVSLSLGAMRKIGIYLWKAGFDVWVVNVRGHGSINELTTVHPYSKGEYQFDYMITEDAPAVVDYVYHLTGKKVHLFGYSMGGMIWEQYLSGTYLDNNDGKIKQSDELIAQRKAKVQDYIAFATPPDFEKIPKTIRWIMAPLYPIVRANQFFIPLCKILPREEEGFSLINRIRRGIMRPVIALFPNLIPRGIVNDNNFTKNEFFQLIENDLSCPHSDYTYDFLRWLHRENYTSRDGEIDYGLHKKLTLPTLFIAGTADHLAPAEEIIKKGLEHPKESEARFLILKNYAHVDMVAVSALPLFGKIMIDFYQKNPKGLKAGEIRQVN